MCCGLTPPFEGSFSCFIQINWRLNEVGLRYRIVRKVEDDYGFSLKA